MSRARALDARLLSTPVVLAELHARAQPARLGGMARVGIRTERALGVSMPGLRALAKRIGSDAVRELTSEWVQRRPAAGRRPSRRA